MINIWSVGMSNFFTPEVISSHIGDCGCPEQELIVGMACVTIHLEPNGVGDCFVDMGESEYEIQIEANSIDDLRTKISRHIESLGFNNEL